MNDHPGYTARNSNRWQDEVRKAQRYLNPAKSLPQAAVDRAQVLRKALALRHSHRITAGIRVLNGGTREQQILHDFLMRLHGVREAENVERLIDRDRVLSGYIAGLIEGRIFSHDEAIRAISLRVSAFGARRVELLLREAVVSE